MKLTMDVWQERIRKAAQRGVYKAAVILQDAVKANLNLVRSPRHGPSAAAPGEPPGKRTGTLGRSINIDDVGLAEANPRCRIGTNLVYAAIHEFGGTISQREGRVTIHMPERPYFRPAISEKTQGMRDAIRDALAGAIRGKH